MMLTSRRLGKPYAEVHEQIDECIVMCRMNHYGKDESHPHRRPEDQIKDDSNTLWSSRLAKKISSELLTLKAQHGLPDVY